MGASFNRSGWGVSLLSMAQSDAVLKLVQSLSEAVVYTEPTNIDTNRKLWNQYAKDWSRDAEFVTKMVSNLPGQPSPSDHLAVLGDEWSDTDSLQVVFDNFFESQLTPSARVAEIGSGGGRVAGRVVARVAHLSCFDISREMLQTAKTNLKEHADKLSFILLEEAKLPAALNESLDFVYAFDVFPHVDLHTIWAYIKEFKRVLKPGGRALIHTANLLSEMGWARFAQQKKYTAGGFYFLSPDMVRCLIARAEGLRIVKESSLDDQRSMYYQRDYIVLVEKL